MTNLNQSEFDKLSDNEKRIQILADTIRGSVEHEIIGLEKVLSIKLDTSNYPMIKSLSTHSDKSLSYIIGQLTNIGLSSLLERFSEDELKSINKEAKSVYDEWVKQVMEERGAN